MSRNSLPESLTFELERALEMIDAAEQPLLLVGQGVIQSGAAAAVRALAEKADIPVAATLLGLGAFPATHPLALGMMGMHGEAWVNHAIQEADLVVALGMRFDDRVTGDPKTFAAKAKKIHVEIDRAEIGKTVKCDLNLVADLRTVAGAPHGRCARPHARGVARSDCVDARGGVTPRHLEARRRRPAARGPRHRRIVARHRRARARGHRRRATPDVGGAVLQARAAALARHLGRARHHGLRAAGGDRRPLRPARTTRSGSSSATAGFR